MTPTWGYEVISGASGEWDEAAMAAQQKLMDEWKTIDACEREFAARFEKLDTLYRTMPDADFTKTKWLPYNGGRDHTYLEMMDYPRWNCTYHLGQIAYIQTMLGDKEMH